jgi:hypothetical protein
MLETNLNEYQISISEPSKVFLEMLGAEGFTEPSELNRSHINKRVDLNQIVTLEDICPYSEVGILRDKSELIYQ